MMTMTGKGERRTRGAAPGTGRPNPQYKGGRLTRTGRSGRLGRSSPYGYALAGLALVALGLTWALGLVGCGPVQSSGYIEASSGGAFPNAHQSRTDVARLLRNSHYYKLMGRPELALKELELAHHQDPDNLQIVNTLAQNYEALGHFDRARTLYQEALTRQPNPALANNLCFTYYLEGRYQEAEACFRQTLARDPSNEAARNNLGLLYCRLGRQDEARQLWQEAEGSAAAAYKTRQALAALGLSDGAVYARTHAPAPPVQETSPPPPVVAAVPTPPAPGNRLQTPAAPLAPQKVAMQLPPQPVPATPRADNDEPLQVVPEEPAPLKTAAVPAAPAAPERPERAVAAPTSQPALAVKPAASPPRALAAASPPPASPSGKVHTPAVPLAPQTVAGQVAPQPAPAPVATSGARPAYLTCAELVDTAIEVRNGTPAPHLAREVRALLEQDAFTVSKIGNHVDFGAARTIIYYRPVALRVAQVLQTDIFPMASLEPSDRLRSPADIKVLLGHDLLENPDLMARLRGDEVQPAAAMATPSPTDNVVTAPAAAPLPAPVAQAPPLASPPEPLTAAELADTAIEVRNGTRTHNLAHQTRTRLDQEGFSVAKIGNHINFGAAQTIIYYRPEAQRVAWALGRTLFPIAALEPSTKLHKNIAVKILLGADLLERPQVMARLAAEGQ